MIFLRLFVKLQTQKFTIGSVEQGRTSLQLKFVAKKQVFAFYFNLGGFIHASKEIVHE
jgi:hypothetical protein